MLTFPNQKPSEPVLPGYGEDGKKKGRKGSFEIGQVVGTSFSILGDFDALLVDILAPCSSARRAVTLPRPIMKTASTKKVVDCIFARRADI